MGRITEMQVRRARLTKNDMDVLKDCVKTLRSEKTEANSTSATLEGIRDILQKKRTSKPQDSP